MLGWDSPKDPFHTREPHQNPKTQEGPLYDPRLHFKCRSSLFTHARKRTRSTTLLIIVFLLITLLRIFLLCALAPYQYSLIVVPDIVPLAHGDSFYCKGPSFCFLLFGVFTTLSPVCALWLRSKVSVNYITTVI